MEDMGARIAPNKCKLFAIGPAFQQWLKRYKWPSLGITLEDVSTMRGLGSQLTTSRTATSHSAARLAKASGTLTRINWLPHGSAFKSKLMLTCAHAHRFFLSAF